MRIIDDNGYNWTWNGRRVYCVEAEEEFIDKGWDTKQNGYPAFFAEDAIKILVNGGYIQGGRATL